MPLAFLQFGVVLQWKNARPEPNSLLNCHLLLVCGWLGRVKIELGGGGVGAGKGARESGPLVSP